MHALDVCVCVSGFAGVSRPVSSRLYTALVYRRQQQWLACTHTSTPHLFTSEAISRRLFELPCYIGLFTCALDTTATTSTTTVTTTDRPETDHSVRALTAPANGHFIIQRHWRCWRGFGSRADEMCCGRVLEPHALRVCIAVVCVVCVRACVHY